MYQIKNEYLTLKMNASGAEMRSLKDNQTGTEYLWQADPAYWGRTSPVLFPLVGNYKEKETIFEGQKYHLSQHGFARDMEFEVISEAEQEIWFALNATEETLKVFPFTFRLCLGYRLNGRTVEVLWKVENTDTKTMYFSIGGHPAFNCPLADGEAQTDYKIAFDTDKAITYHILNADGLLAKEERQLTLEDNQLQITKTLFDEDAFIIEDHQAQEVSLVTPEGEKYLTVTFDAPLFGLWSPKGKGAPFICIEPWYGRSDKEDFCQRLEDREWGNQLMPGEVFESSYTISV